MRLALSPPGKLVEATLPLLVSRSCGPDGPFGRREANAPGELMEIDSTPLDVLVRLSDGVVGRVELTALVDVATRTVTAAVLRPTTKAPDASVLLARTVTPEPMRPGWPQAMVMAESALPFRRLLGIDERLRHAAETIARETNASVTPVVADHGTREGRQALLKACPQPDILVITCSPPKATEDFREISEEDWYGSVTTTLVGPIELIKATVDGMADRRWGRIVNIATGAAKHPTELRLLS